MTLFRYVFLKKLRDSKAGIILLGMIWLLCGAIYLTGSLIAPTLIDDFYTHLFGTLFFVTAAVIQIKAILAERDSRNLQASAISSAKDLRRWPPGSGRIFLLTLGFLLAVALAFVLVFY